MSVDGTWKITLETPLGARSATLTLASAGSALNGTMSGDAGSTEIYDGKVDGDQISFKADVTQPMPLTLAFSATVNGGALSGSVALGMFGDAPLSGTRG
jgi:hypothetical protein